MTGVIQRDEWIDKVRETISADWIPMFDHFEDKFLKILYELHDNYHPRANGEWDATPGWTEIFKWTSCPSKSLKAVLILKDPLQLYETSHYQSTGYAFGVKRTDPNGDIEIVASVWNFFKLLYQLNNSWSGKEREVEREIREAEREIREAEREIRDRFQKGFNPEYLSNKQGILFLNLALTKAKDPTKDNLFDVNKIWDDFLLHVVGFAIQKLGITVPMIQFYNNGKIAYFLSKNERGKNFNTFLPSFMNCQPENWEVGHIAYFGNYEIERYIEELCQPAYQQHRLVLHDIFSVVKNQHTKLQYDEPLNTSLTTNN